LWSGQDVALDGNPVRRRPPAQEGTHSR
jgi:hypothetical protein